MRRSDFAATRLVRRLLPAALGAAALAACAEQQPLGVREPQRAPASVIQAFTCAGSRTGGVRCITQAGTAGAASTVFLGNTRIKLASSNSTYDTATSIFQFDVTVQNLMNEAVGTPEGTVADPNGLRVFFQSGPTTTSGTGSVTVANPDGLGTFTGANQPYFVYNQILTKNAVSSPKTWQLIVPSTVASFSFTVYVAAEVQPLLVVNEVMANPGSTITDRYGEWFEVYNAGTLPVQMQGLLIADSASTGRQPYHVIGSSLSVPPGGYVTLGSSSDTTLNGGATIDYSYGAALALANTGDAVKIARVYGTDTLTLDRVGFTTTSAMNGISRELKNPSLDNSNADGGNWAYASSFAVYGPAGLGTPKAQNSTYTP